MVPVAGYLRVAALGDSTTVGVGDPVVGGWRGWSRHLVDALRTTYEVSYCNVAVSGSTTVEVRRDQLADAVAHRPDLASLVVGGNDTMRSGWCPQRVRADLLHCADRLTAAGATLMTVRLHDHPATVPGLPGWVRRPLSARVAMVNDAYDEVHARYGGVRVDLAQSPEVLRRECWSVDRLHPSELGHRALARAFAQALAAAGYDVPLPPAEASGGLPPTWRRDVAWVVTEAGPWFGRRARDLGPWAAQAAWTEARSGLGRLVGSSA